jgi:hypothetical protein
LTSLVLVFLVPLLETSSRHVGFLVWKQRRFLRIKFGVKNILIVDEFALLIPFYFSKTRKGKRSVFLIVNNKQVRPGQDSNSYTAIWPNKKTGMEFLP